MNITETTWLQKNHTISGLKEQKKISNTHSDVAIVGGGIAGLLSAYLLVQEGKKVSIYEKFKIGQGVTSLTTAFITEAVDTDFADLIKIYGLKHAKEIISSHREAIELIENIVNWHNIDCDFMRCSNYIYATSEKESKQLKTEYVAMKKIGVKADYVEKDATLEILKNGYIEIRNQAKFHPMKFVDGLTKLLIELGVDIYEGKEVVDILPALPYKELEINSIDGKQDAFMMQLYFKNKESVTADYVVVATYEAFNKPLKLYFEKGTYVSYIMELEVKNLELPEAMFEDMMNPYHYFRIDKSEKGVRVIVGGEDHRKDIHIDPDRNFNALNDYATKLFGKGNFKVVRTWSGPILEPVDGIAAIGALRRDDNILYATGFSGNGMTYAGIAAMVLKDTIIGKKNLWKKIYSAKRVPTFKALMIKGKDYAGELVHGALKNRLTQEKVPHVKKQTRGN